MNLQTNQSSTSTNHWPADALPEHWIEKIFEKMKFQFGKSYYDKWGAIDGKQSMIYWGKELFDLTAQELRRGYEAISHQVFAINVAEFRRLCRPDVDPVVAYYTALNQGERREKGEMGDWPHPAIYWAWAKIGSFDFRNLGYTQLKPRWEAALHEQFAKSKWDGIPDPRLAISAPGKSETNTEEAREQIKKVEALCIPKVAHGREWAYRLLERAKNDSSISHFSIKAAQAAIRSTSKLMDYVDGK